MAAPVLLAERELLNDRAFRWRGLSALLARVPPRMLVAIWRPCESDIEVGNAKCDATGVWMGYDCGGCVELRDHDHQGRMHLTH